MQNPVGIQRARTAIAQYLGIPNPVQWIRAAEILKEHNLRLTIKGVPIVDLSGARFRKHLESLSISHRSAMEIFDGVIKLWCTEPFEGQLDMAAIIQKWPATPADPEAAARVIRAVLRPLSADNT